MLTSEQNCDLTKFLKDYGREINGMTPWFLLREFLAWKNDEENFKQKKGNLNHVYVKNTYQSLARR